MNIVAVSEDELSTITPSHWRWGESAASAYATLDSKGKIVAGLRIFDRQMHYGSGVLLSVAGIGGVITIPELRGGGLARCMVDHVCKDESSFDYVGFIANSRKGANFFHHAGFFVIGASTTKKDQDLFWRPMNYEHGVVILNDREYEIELLPESHF